MNLTEAVIAVLQSNRCITLPEFRDTAKTQPTNTAGNCIVVNVDGNQLQGMLAIIRKRLITG